MAALSVSACIFAQSSQRDSGDPNQKYSPDAELQ
jgi:hypothetical protein